MALSVEALASARARLRMSRALVRSSLAAVLAATLLPASIASAEPRWSDPIEISSRDAYAAGPFFFDPERVPASFNARGEAIVMWRSNAADGMSMWLAERGLDRVWSAPRRLSREGVQSPTGALAMNDRGDAVAVFLDEARICSPPFCFNGVRTLMLTRRTPGGDWSAPQRISSDYRVGEARVAIDDSGRAVIAWEASGLTETIDQGMQVALMRPDGQVTAPRFVSAPHATFQMFDHSPAIAADGAGGAVIAWTRRMSGWPSDTVLQTTRIRSDGTVAAVQDVGQVAAQVPSVVTSGDGQVAMVWEQESAGVYVAFAESGAPFGAPRRVAVAPAKLPAVALDDAGRATMTWWVFGPGTTAPTAPSTVRVAHGTADGGFDDARTLSTPGGSARPAVLAASPRGDTLAVWSEYEGPGWSARAAIAPPGGDFGEATRLGSMAESGTGAVGAINARGEGLALWNYATDGVSVELVSTFEEHDSTAPTVACAEPEDRWQAGAVTVACTATDEGAGLADQADASFDLVASVDPGIETANARTNSRPVCDTEENCTVAGPIDGIRIDRRAPVIQLACPAGPIEPSSSATASYTATDGGSGLATQAAGTVQIDTTSAGRRTVAVTAADTVGNTAAATCDVDVVYAWRGFFSPVDNRPTLNAVKAGSAIPVKFSLGGDRGLDVLAAGYPGSQAIECSSSAELDEVEETASHTDQRLQYDTEDDQYIYVWRTDRSWAGSCRQLVVKLVDGTSHRADFRFR